MKSLKTKVIMSAAVLVFALIATIGSTYAWFTVSNTASVNTLQLTVQSSEALLIRPGIPTDTETLGQAYGDYDLGPGNAAWTLSDFASTIDLSTTPLDFTDYYATYSQWLLAPVTALAGETAGDTDYTSVDMMALRTLNITDPTERVLTSASSNSTGGDFIELSFWLVRTSSEGTSKDVNLDFNVTGTYANALHIGVLGDNLATGTIAFSGNQMTASAGIDFTTFGLVDGDKIVIGNTGTANGGVYTVDTDTNAITTTTMDVEETFTLQSATADINIDYGEKQTIFSTERDYDFAFTASDAGFDSTGGSVLNSVVNPSALVSINAGVDNSTHVVHLEQANVPELIIVRIWIEGWDNETTNAIMNSQFNVDLSFKLV